MTKAPKALPLDKQTKPQLIRIIKQLQKQVAKLEALRVSFQPSVSELEQIAGAEANDPRTTAEAAALQEAEAGGGEVCTSQELAEWIKGDAPVFPWEKK